MNHNAAEDIVQNVLFVLEETRSIKVDFLKLEVLNYKSVYNRSYRMNIETEVSCSLGEKYIDCTYHYC